MRADTPAASRRPAARCTREFVSVARLTSRWSSGGERKNHALKAFFCASYAGPMLGHGPTPPREPFQRWPRWAAGCVLVAAVFGAYANSFRGAFVFDDIPAILEN